MMQTTIVECRAMDHDMVLRTVDIARACAQSEDWVLQLVQASILEPLSQDAGDARFGGEALFVARRVQRLQRDLGVNLEGAALALELLRRIDELQARLRRAGLEP